MEGKKGERRRAYFGSQFEDSIMAAEACWWEHETAVTLNQKS